MACYASSEGIDKNLNEKRNGKSPKKNIDTRIGDSKQMNLFKNLKKVVEDYWIWIFIILILSCGCTTWKWEHNPPTQYEWEAEEQPDGGWDRAAYRYYVIDANADEPDAYFETENEALEYKKDFAEYHDYVIVKIDEKYNVYNMAKPIKILDN